MLTLKYTYDSRNFRFFMSQKVEKPSLSGHRLKTRKRGKSTGHYIVFNNNSVKISMCNMNVALAITCINIYGLNLRISIDMLFLIEFIF